MSMFVELGRASAQTRGLHYTSTEQDPQKLADLTVDPSRRYRSGEVPPYVKIEDPV